MTDRAPEQLQLQAEVQQFQMQQAYTQQQRAAQQVAGLTAASNIAGLGCLMMVLAPIVLGALLFVIFMVAELIKASPLTGISVACGLFAAVCFGLRWLLRLFSK